MFDVGRMSIDPFLNDFCYCLSHVARRLNRRWLAPGICTAEFTVNTIASAIGKKRQFRKCAPKHLLIEHPLKYLTTIGVHVWWRWRICRDALWPLEVIVVVASAP